jgi:hypothetical protein
MMKITFCFYLAFRWSGFWYIFRISLPSLFLCFYISGLNNMDEYENCSAFCSLNYLGTSSNQSNGARPNKSVRRNEYYI